MLLKRKRIVDRNIVDHVRNKRDGVCMYGLHTKDACSGGLDPHHIIHRGAGGGDEVENLITLCRKHHNSVHSGKISKKELYDILESWFGYKYG